MTAVTAQITPSAHHRAFDRLSRDERNRLLLEEAAAADSPVERTRIQQRVVELNMPLAARVATRYRGRGIPVEDLEQVAFTGLVKAVRRYEYAPDREFVSFAMPTIRGEIKKYFRDHGWAIRPTRPVQTAQARIAEAEGDLLQELGRAPRPSELAQHLELDLDLVIEAMSANGCFQPTSLEATLSSAEGPLQVRLGTEDPEFGRVEARALLRPLLAGLTERERLMVQMRFFEDKTQSEIGEVLGITQMQVSRLLSSLMTRLRDEAVADTPRAAAAPPPAGALRPA